MTKLAPRYAPDEKARLLATMKPVERWTKYERYLWDRSHYGFRHFAASNITPIEHYMPEPIGVFEAFGRDSAPKRRRQTPRSQPPPRKPAA